MKKQEKAMKKQEKARKRYVQMVFK